ncbi:MAG: copper chaperone PCu(A)C [Pseudomonadota bacterium]
MINRSWAGLWIVLVAQTSAAQPELQISDAWVRALPPSQNNTAAYMTLFNAGIEPARVISVTSDLAGRVEIHRSQHVDGYMRMEQLDDLTVPAGARVLLEPGGTHLMLLDVERMPAPGETVRICLTAQVMDEVCTDAPVRKGADVPNPHAHH